MMRIHTEGWKKKLNLIHTQNPEITFSLLFKSIKLYDYLLSNVEFGL